MILLSIYVSDYCYAEMQIESLSFSSSSGELQILSNHTDGFFVLNAGIVRIKTSGVSKKYFFINEGLVSFLDNQNAKLTTNSIIDLSDIDHKNNLVNELSKIDDSVSRQLIDQINSIK